jgi:hypothetical protein
VLLIAVLHSVFNRTNNDNGIAAALLEGDGRPVAVLIAAVVLTAAAVLAIRRRSAVTRGPGRCHPDPPRGRGQPLMTEPRPVGGPELLALLAGSPR